MKITTFHWFMYPLTLHLIFTLCFANWINQHNNPYLIGSVAMWVSMVITYFELKHLESIQNVRKK